MEKPVFSSDILSFCKEMGVESPEQLIGKKIYFKFLSPNNGPGPIITFSEILRISFGIGKNEKDKRISLHFSESALSNETHVLHYSLGEKKWKILQAQMLQDGKWWYGDVAYLEEIYIYPDSVK